MGGSSDCSGILLKKDIAKSAGHGLTGALSIKFLEFKFYDYNCVCLLASQPVRAKISSANS